MVEMSGSHHKGKDSFSENEILHIKVIKQELEILMLQLELRKLKFLLKIAERDHKFDSTKYMGIK